MEPGLPATSSSGPSPTNHHEADVGSAEGDDAGPEGGTCSRSPSTTSASVSPRPQQPQSQPSLGGAGVATPPPSATRAPPPASTVGGLGPPTER